MEWFDSIISQEDQYEVAKARCEISVTMHYAVIELDNFIEQVTAKEV